MFNQDGNLEIFENFRFDGDSLGKDVVGVIA